MRRKHNSLQIKILFLTIKHSKKNNNFFLHIFEENKNSNFVKQIVLKVLMYSFILSDE